MLLGENEFPSVTFGGQLFLREHGQKIDLPDDQITSTDDLVLGIPDRHPSLWNPGFLAVIWDLWDRHLNLFAVQSIDDNDILLLESFVPRQFNSSHKVVLDPDEPIMKDFLNDEDDVLESPIGFPLIPEAFEPHLGLVLVAAGWDVNVDVDRGGARLVVERRGG